MTLKEVESTMEPWVNTVSFSYGSRKVPCSSYPSFDINNGTLRNYKTMKQTVTSTHTEEDSYTSSNGWELHAVWFESKVSLLRKAETNFTVPNKPNLLNLQKKKKN